MSLDPEILRRFPLFHGLPEDLLARVAAFCRRKRCPKNATVLRQGDPAAAFFLVEYGAIKVFRAGPDGREQVLHVVEPGQSFAEAAALSLETYPAHAVAVADSSVIVVPRTQFNALVSADPRAARAMLAGQARWMRRLADLASSVTLEEVPVRLARYLAGLLPPGGGNAGEIRLPTTKTVLAARLGTVPETLSRAFARLEKDGLIKRRGKSIVVLDAAGLGDVE